MKQMNEHWYDIRCKRPPCHQKILCFNGIPFIAEWDGQHWISDFFENNPTTDPPSHWRELPNYHNDTWETYYI